MSDAAGEAVIRRRYRRRLRSIGFAAIVLGVLAIGQEVFFRALFPLPEVSGFNRIGYQMLAGTHPNLRETMKRGLACVDLRFESRPDGFVETHRLNIYGFRGSDFSIDPTVGRRRVLVLGDSVAEGQGAGEASTIAVELARRLDRAEVLNLGVVAADLPRLARLARDATALLRPSDVVLVLYANDLPAPPWPGGALDGPPPAFPRRSMPWWTPRAVELIGRVIAGQAIYRRWPRPVLPFFPAVPDPGNPWSRVTDPPADVDPALYGAMREGAINPWLAEQARAMPGMLAHDFALGGSPAPYLQRMERWCRAVGARLTVVYVPFCGVIDGHYGEVLEALGLDAATAEALADDAIYRRQNAHLAELCVRLAIPLVDTTDALMAAERSGVRQCWEFDTHPRPAGYATIGRTVAEAWKRGAAKVGVTRESRRDR